MDDLLSADIGKHDYDWLLTPPGTPIASDTKEHKSSIASRSISNVRSVSNLKTSRLSVSHMENGHSARPARSISATRASISTPNSSSCHSVNNRTSSLNTSSASIASRPSTPGNRSASVAPSSRTTPAAATTSRPTASALRSSTPTRTRHATTLSTDKSRPTPTSRPSTPSGRPQSHSVLIPNSNPNPMPSRPSSRSSTPTRRTTVAPPPLASRSPSVGRISATSTRATGPTSRPSSPAPKTQASVYPVLLPDFSVEVPPNLRTKLPERPASAGRTRPGMATLATPAAGLPLTSGRRSSSPVVSRGMSPDNNITPKAHPLSSGGNAVAAVVLPEDKKSSSLDSTLRKPMKPAVVPAMESTGFGRTISKKSMDMALRHMDIRLNLGSVRGTSLFPQSIRSSVVPKSRTYARTSDPTIARVNGALHFTYENGDSTTPRDCNGTATSLWENGSLAGIGPTDSSSPSAMTTELDVYGSYRYDSILLKEDSRNMSWLHSTDDHSDQSPDFDHRFGDLTEPFAPL